MAERKVLGKGLGALIPDIKEDFEKGKEFFYCSLDQIQLNPYQPRTVFNQEKIEELTQSIKERGIIQPLLVKKVKGGYQLIAGERRLRAARSAGLEKVPILVKNVSDSEQLECSLIENLQREDLNPIEEAESYQKLMRDFNYTQHTLSQVIGKNRATIANQLRLLKLPELVKKSLARNEISMGHARSLLSLNEQQKQKEAFRIVLGKGLSVRDTERLVKRLSREKEQKGRAVEKRSIHLEAVIDDLRKCLNTKVNIVQRGKKGRIIVEFYSAEELERIIERIKGEYGKATY